MTKLINNKMAVCGYCKLSLIGLQLDQIMFPGFNFVGWRLDINYT